jgi:hypothetical protein
MAILWTVNHAEVPLLLKRLEGKVNPHPEQMIPEFKHIWMTVVALVAATTILTSWLLFLIWTVEH